VDPGALHLKSTQQHLRRVPHALFGARVAVVDVGVPLAEVRGGATLPLPRNDGREVFRHRLLHDGGHASRRARHSLRVCRLQ